MLYTNRVVLCIKQQLSILLQAAKGRLFQNGYLGQFCKVPDIIICFLAVYPYFHITLSALIENVNFWG